jgi:putative PEP-CTERM system histidine kinase
MNTAGFVGYGAAGFAFLFLTILLALNGRARNVAARLIVAAVVTSLWAFILAFESRTARVPLLFVYLAEAARNGAWLFVLSQLAAAVAPRPLIIGAQALWAVVMVVGFSIPFLPLMGIEVDAFLVSRAGLALALCGLLLLEQIYRNSNQAGRAASKYLVIGVGGMLMYEVFIYSQAELIRAIPRDAWAVRGFVSALAVPFIALAVRRNPQWSLDIFVSRQVVFYTTTLAAVGVYLIIMAAAGYIIRDLGGSWGTVGQILFFVGASVVLVFLVSSGPLRREVAVFISKHFYRNKYDYRVEWLRFISTLSSGEGDDIRQTCIRAVAQIISSPGGVLFLADPQARKFVPVGAWPMSMDSVSDLQTLDAQSGLVQFINDRHWIIDMHEYRRTPDVYDNIEMPRWLEQSAFRVVSPIFQLDQLLGFFVFYDPPPPFDLTYEDRDLLKTVGRHVGIQLAQHDADRRLAESRQFEAYNRLTAFMMHDLKNSVAQLQLIVANAHRHKHNPEFVDDVVDTIGNAVERMTRLIEQICSPTATAATQSVRFDQLVKDVVARCKLRSPAPELKRMDDAEILVRADPQRLAAVLEHVIRNAQEAAVDGAVCVTLEAQDDQAVLVVTDTGKGMAPEFVRERLFQPFYSTKGSKGMGIGAYQAREYVSMLGGRVEVQSSPGRGTSFSITLPAQCMLSGTQELAVQ